MLDPLSFHLDKLDTPAIEIDINLTYLFVDQYRALSKLSLSTFNVFYFLVFVDELGDLLVPIFLTFF